MVKRTFTDSEFRARRAAQIAKLGYWDADLDNNILYYSPEYLIVHGLPPDTIITRQEQTNALMHPDDRGWVNDLFKQYDTYHEDYSIEYRIIRPDGEICYVREVGEIVHNDEGVPIGHTGTTQDISDERKDQARLSEALAQATSSLKAKDLFLANISHEFRTPLNAISGYAELLELRDSLKLEPDQIDRYVKSIIQAGRHLNGIIGEILLYIEINQQQRDLQIQKTRIDAFLDEAVVLSGLELSKVAPNYAVTVEPQNAEREFDERLVLQAMINIIGNAIKHGGDDNRIDIAFSETDGGFEFRVSDKGAGIPEAELEKILSPFYRGIRAGSV